MLSAGQVDYHCSISCQGIIKNSSRLSCFAMIPSVPSFDSIKTDGTPWAMVFFIISFIFASKTDDLLCTILCRSYHPEMSTHWIALVHGHGIPAQEDATKARRSLEVVHVRHSEFRCRYGKKTRKNSSGGTLLIVNHLRFLMLEMEELTVQIVLTEAKDGEFRYLAKNGGD